ncbi:hypothetical protein [Roseibium sp. Sym1]|uniref:hypothetical protein n=1 Tax=Roseibium sp. Sym1 TaxID=3016006 RepID=UPI0022B5951D|nr:hypothetical protein [Roseibium sp. Sym1]
MTSDPTLFTSLEWVLLALAGLVSLLLFALFHRAERGSPFAERDEHWSRDPAPCRKGKAERG